MKMMIKSLMLVAVMMFAASVQADTTSYLYWMVGNAGEYSDAEYAKIAYTEDGGQSYTWLVNANPGSSGGEAFYNFFYDQYAAISGVTLGSSYRFFVELFNEGGTSLARTEMLAYENIQNSIGSEVYSISEQAVFNIPEPTSGMLALMGFGLLALRRKQRKA